jgi:four helix bundle protein
LNYPEWEASVPAAIRADALWRMKAYRLALFASDIGWQDVTRLAEDKRTRGLADQLFRALGSIGANIAEGYSRSSHKEKARFYEYALGSARESRDWYYKARHILNEDVLGHRLDLLTQITRLLLVTIPAERSLNLREDTVEYKLDD